MSVVACYWRRPRQVWEHMLGTGEAAGGGGGGGGGAAFDVHRRRGGVLLFKGGGEEVAPGSVRHQELTPAPLPRRLLPGVPPPYAAIWPRSQTSQHSLLPFSLFHPPVTAPGRGGGANPPPPAILSDDVTSSLFWPFRFHGNGRVR